MFLPYRLKKRVYPASKLTGRGSPFLHPSNGSDDDPTDRREHPRTSQRSSSLCMIFFSIAFRSYSIVCLGRKLYSRLDFSGCCLDDPPRAPANFIKSMTPESAPTRTWPKHGGRCNQSFVRFRAFVDIRLLHTSLTYCTSPGRCRTACERDWAPLSGRPKINHGVTVDLPTTSFNTVCLPTG